jgi:serine/threonine-protein kinase
VPLSAGTRFGPYEVLDLIGIGGMGEVYRARDTRLDRTIALKVLPAPFAAETSARARFEREARAISALEHPHICTLHDVGEENGLAYLVMEHLRGETLAERLKRGPLPLDQTLEFGVEIADALATAHRQGIVHRDLKPGNVVLTQTGVKLLDFGLARLTHESEPTGVEATASVETAAMTLTARGAILGTMPYMAPEQLEGRPADARADIWALGAILYEMVTGTRAFGGRSSASVVAAILEREPEPLSVRQPLTPEALERAVKRCLAKSPDERWDSARDLGAELRWIAEAGRRPAPRRSERAAWPRRVGWLAAGLALAAVAALVLRATWPAPPAGRVAGPTVVRSAVSVRPAKALDTAGASGTWMPTPGGSRTALAFTPDGRSLVFVGRGASGHRLYVRPLDADEARPLEGTEGARAVAVSPDGRWAAFWADGAIRRVPLEGGPVGLVADAVPLPPGIEWGPSGEVIFSGADGPLLAADPDRPPRPLTREEPGELSHRLPHLLPGGRALLYTVRHRTCTWGDDEVVVERLDSGERFPLLHDAADARYGGTPASSSCAAGSSTRSPSTP